MSDVVKNSEESLKETFWLHLDLETVPLYFSLAVIIFQFFIAQ